MEILKVGIVQLQVGRKKQENLEKVAFWTKLAAQEGANVVVWPEMFCCPYELSSFPLFAESFPEGEALALMAQLAKKHEIYLVGGSLPERFGNSLYNSSFIFDPKGKLVGLHRKIHLFDVHLPEVQFTESQIFSPGKTPTIFHTPWGKMGVMICYDVRFPELARLYALQGAVVIFVPAAFNHITGPSHWELIFRARALDNQVFMVGAAPAPHPAIQYRAYGHSIITNPWGSIRREMGEEEGFFVETLDLQKIHEVRESLPLLRHRKPEVYTLFIQEDFPLSPSYAKLIEKNG